MDMALKQRLVGASVLIALAVVVLPMLLGGRPENGAGQSQKIELPPQPPELDFETRRYPIGESPTTADREPDKPTERPLPSPSPPPARTEDSLSETVTETVEGTAAAKQGERGATEPAAEAPSELALADMPPGEPPAEDPKVAQPVVEDTGRYIVQVASFGAVENARRLSATLESHGYPVMTDTVKSDVGTLHRVRIGPWSSEAEANDTAARLRTQIGDVKPRVMDLQPEKAAQVTTPSDPLVRWVVQVGSFSSAVNADKLVARLRLESMSAYKEEVNSSGSPIYRVRIGPFLEREEAIRIDADVRERMSLDGVVMSAD